MRMQYETAWPHWQAWAVEDDGRVIREFGFVRGFLWGLVHWREKRPEPCPRKEGR